MLTEKVDNKETNERMLFVNFIFCIYLTRADETTTETHSQSSSCTSSDYSESHDVIRLCLYGETEAARLLIVPDVLDFGDLLVGQVSQRVLRLTNPSTVAPIYLEFVPNAAARSYPSRMRLKSEESIETVVKVRGKESGDCRSTLPPTNAVAFERRSEYICLIFVFNVSII